MPTAYPSELTGYCAEQAYFEHQNPELAENLTARAERQFPLPQVSHRLDTQLSCFWTDAAREMGVRMPEGFVFNRAHRIDVGEGKRYRVGSHRDHPDMQGLICVLQTEGESQAVVDGHRLALKGLCALTLTGWPIGQPYPEGKRYSLAFSSDDPRTQHDVWCTGVRKAIVLSYDAFPDFSKQKFTSARPPASQHEL